MSLDTIVSSPDKVRYTATALLGLCPQFKPSECDDSLWKESMKFLALRGVYKEVVASQEIEKYLQGIVANEEGEDAAAVGCNDEDDDEEKVEEPEKFHLSVEGQAQERTLELYRAVFGREPDRTYWSFS